MAQEARGRRKQPRSGQGEERRLFTDASGADEKEWNAGKFLDSPKTLCGKPDPVIPTGWVRTSNDGIYGAPCLAKSRSRTRSWACTGRNEAVPCVWTRWGGEAVLAGPA